MAYAYHENRQRYFEHQCRVTADYVIPFIEGSGSLLLGARVLEIGCGEAGVLKAFLERGAHAVGVDRNATRLNRGKQLLADAIAEGRLTLLHRDALTLGNDEQFIDAFDLIILKDVIEHIDDRPALFALMTRLLRPAGRVFMAFPPWQMPFGGHQQICRSRVLSRLPYVHLLPMPTYEKLLRAFGEQPGRVSSLVATKRTGISTLQFDELLDRCNYQAIAKQLYLINPMYSYRFGLQPMKQADWVARHPRWRDFVTTCAYYVLKPKSDAKRS